MSNTLPGECFTTKGPAYVYRSRNVSVLMRSKRIKCRGTFYSRHIFLSLRTNTSQHSQRRSTEEKERALRCPPPSHPPSPPHRCPSHRVGLFISRSQCFARYFLLEISGIPISLSRTSMPTRIHLIPTQKVLIATFCLLVSEFSF